ncbi:tetratricopeptide repeat protein [Marinomonas communis]|uniref:tetratricopeptide repeat protein n=1 Tax=Marinomonas communis TaxID=28254 RepID=UPI001D18AD06|nr:glycosyltransferase family 2 protein [Marinomonas communis]MCC4274496.1 tetratricopeptide repeat protein [Marinomonas communis]
MASIAAVMIVRDEEEHLAACLDSLKKVCDEFVIVDTGSVDRTIEIASKYTNQVHQFTWSGDFSKARNFAISKVLASEWCLVIDADEVIQSPMSAKQLLQSFISNNTPNTLGTIEVLSYGFRHSKEIKYRHSISRFFHKGCYAYQGSIHEQLIPLSNTPTVKRLPSGISVLHSGYIQDKHSPQHKSHRNIDMLKQAIDLSPNDEYLHYQLGQAYFSQDNFQDAEQSLSKALELIDFSHPVPQGTKNTVSRGVLTGLITSYCYSLLNLNKLETASEFMTFHFNLNHYGVMRADFFHAFGHLKIALEDLQGALDAFEVSLELGAEKEDVLGSGSYASLFNIGIIFETAKDPDKALEFYTAALSLKPAFEPAVERIVSFTLDYKAVFPEEIYKLGNEETWLNAFTKKAAKTHLNFEQQNLLEQNINNISRNALRKFKSMNNC